MEYDYRKQFHKIEEEINMMAMYVQNLSYKLRDNRILLGLNDTLNSMYRTYIFHVISEKTQIYEAQLKSYTNKDELEQAKKQHDSMVSYSEFIASQYYNWV